MVRFFLAEGIVADRPLEQHGLEQEETEQASAGAFLTELLLPTDPRCWQGSFCAALYLVTEPLLLQESAEVERGRADDFLEHCFPPGDCRSRVSQQVS